MESSASCPQGAGGVPKGPVTRALIKDILARSLAEMGYECPESDLEKFVRTATPVASRAATPAWSANSSRTQSPVRRSNKKKGKRCASSSSEEETTGSDSTVVGTDSESENTTSEASETEKPTGSRSDSFSLVEGKNKKAIRKAIKKKKTTDSPPHSGMEVDAAQTESSSPAPLPKSPQAQVPVTTSSQVEAARASAPAPAGSKPTAPSRVKMPLQYLCAKALTSSKYPQIVPVCGLIYKSLDNKVQLHTYALEEERKIKMVIRGIPTDSPVEEIKADLCDQGFLCYQCTDYAAATVRLCLSSWSSLGTNEAKPIKIS
ncbi:hypothetical protein EVAR_100339_1 [Eumeta japonica]|uniref:Uncharacterized protein n=1 Tax=Eumeta variegata TaxID=151549 RepID=A0A4C2AG30_EUMVA|nr:hypothetical protein EVAR_100339_1 [Eumeta japonica]